MTDPKDELFQAPALRREVDHLFRQVLGGFPGRHVPVRLWNPQIDISEERDRFVLEADLPGVRREDVSIEVKGKTLVLTGHRDLLRRSVGEGFCHTERLSGTFQRSIPLPRAVDGERISAALEAGILRVELPKKKAAP